MKNYQEQAEAFLKETGTTLTIKLLGESINTTWGDSESDYRYKYSFKLSNSKGTYKGTFWGSINDYRLGDTELNAYDILTALCKDDPSTIDDFVGNYGYEVKNWKDVKRIEKIYKSCVKEYQGITALFTDSEMEQLREIQ
jgi:hypothetical protein